MKSTGPSGEVVRADTLRPGDVFITIVNLHDTDQALPVLVGTITRDETNGALVVAGLIGWQGMVKGYSVIIPMMDRLARLSPRREVQ